MRFNKNTLYVFFTLVLIVSSCQSIVSTDIHKETQSADLSYMEECKIINHNSLDEQASYEGIYPGVTTEDEVVNLIGEPIRINNLHGKSWEYNNLAVVFNGQYVSELFVGGNDVATIKDMILNYGCSLIIYAVDVNEHPSGNYSQLLFIYDEIGFGFTTDNFPANLNDAVYEMIYFIPETFKENPSLSDFLNTQGASKQISWNEAIK